MERFGLSEVEISTLHQLFCRFPTIERVVIYGSRAMGTHALFSDIDLALYGTSISKDDLSKLIFEVDFLLLPYNLDISVYHRITNPDVIFQIDRVGQLLYSKPVISTI